MENPRRHRLPLPWFIPEPDDALSNTTEGPGRYVRERSGSKGLEIFSRRPHFKPQGGPDNSDWKNDPTLKRAPRRKADIPPLPMVSTKTKRLPRRPLTTSNGRAWIFATLSLVLMLVMPLVLIGVLRLSVLLADSSDESISYSPVDSTNTKLFQEMSSRQAFIKGRLMADVGQEPMARKIRLGIYLVNQSEAALYSSNVPFESGILDAYKNLTADLKSSLHCLPKFAAKLNILLDDLYTGLTHVSRELATLELKSTQRSILTRQLFRSSDGSRMLQLYLPYVESYDNQTTDLLIKGNTCYMQFASLEASWHIVSNLTANSAQSVKSDLSPLYTEISRFLPAWLASSSFNTRFWDLSRQLNLLNAVHNMHVQTWPEVASVAHDLEDVAMEIAELNTYFPFERLGLDGWHARSHLCLALIGARKAEAQMRDRGLRKTVLFDRLWQRRQGARILWDPLWLGAKGMEVPEVEERGRGKCKTRRRATGQWEGEAGRE